MSHMLAMKRILMAVAATLPATGVRAGRAARRPPPAPLQPRAGRADFTRAAGGAHHSARRGRAADDSHTADWVQRILFGSDGATGGDAPPREAWAAFRKLPLTEAELRTIAFNVPPYLQK